MTRTEASSTETGPTSYRNWRAQIDGASSYGADEIAIYSDARITGQIEEGLGPYALINGHPADKRDPALILRARAYLDPRAFSFPRQTNTKGFTGSTPADEIAALVSLQVGARVMAGGVVRFADADELHWRILGDRDRPTPLFPAAGKVPLLPRALQAKSIRPAPFDTFPKLAPDDATALVRAARCYRDALWIAEAEPELAWLLFVSALEVAAVQQHIDRADPIDILRGSKPKLVEMLEGDESLLRDVAVELARDLRATARFLDFALRFTPAPPSPRAPEGFRLDWSQNHLKNCMKKVYAHRSNALHEGVPFPPPMCDSPFQGGPDWEAPGETVIGVAVSTAGGTWVREDLPFPLHTFEYIVRGALLSWWEHLASKAVGPQVGD
jgi:hypothetical protein